MALTKEFEELELNKKLAEWAGFKWHKHRQYVHGPLMHGGRWEDGHWDYLDKCWYDVVGSDGISPHQLNQPPDFTNSLDACFKWLVPKVDYVILSNWNKKKRPTASVFDGEGKCSMATAETPALALCLAMEKLIDKEAE